MHHQNIDENLKTMDSQLVNICKDKTDHITQKFFEKVIKTSKRLIDRNLYFCEEYSTLLNDFTN